MLKNFVNDLRMECIGNAEHIFTRAASSFRIGIREVILHASKLDEVIIEPFDAQLFKFRHIDLSGIT